MSERDVDTVVRLLDREFEEAMKARGQGNLAGALAVLEDLLPRYGEQAAVNRQAMVQVNIGQIRHQTGDLDQARAAYETALQLAEACDDERRIGFARSGLGVLAQETGDIPNAERHYNAALGAFRATEDPVGVANQCGNLGLLRQSQGRITEALDLYNQASVLFFEAGNVRGAIGVLQCMGELHRRQGEFEQAEESHLQAAELASQSGAEILRAHSLRALGHLQRLRGNIDEAVELIRTGYAIHQHMQDRRGELAALIDLGTLEFARGEGERAVGLLDQCIASARATGLTSPLLKAHLNRALYQLDTPKTEEVDADLAAARKLLENVEDPAAWNVWSITRARVCLRRGDWDEAETVLSNELSRTETANLTPARPAVVGLLATLDLYRGDNRKALERFQESEALYRSLGDVEGARLALVAKARMLAESGQATQALLVLDTLEEALELAPEVSPMLQAELLMARATAQELGGAFGPAIATAAECATLYARGGFEMSALGARLAICAIEAMAVRVDGAAVPADHLQRAEALLAEVGRFQSPLSRLAAQLTVAEALHLAPEQRDAQRAGELVEASLEEARSLGSPDVEARALEMLARLRQDVSLAQQALALWRRANVPVRVQRLCEEWRLDN